MIVNMVAAERYIRVIVGVFFILIGVYLGGRMMFLSAFGVLLLFTGSTGYCFSYHLLGFNTRLAKRNFYITKIPKNNPEPVFLFNSANSMLFQNDASKKILPRIAQFNDVYSESEIDQIINQGERIAKRYQEGDLTYQLVSHKSKEEDLIFSYGFNISEIVEKEQALIRESNSDRLTGLLNRKKLVEDIESNSGDYHILLLVDVKGFGQINSFYGYKKGDEFLKSFSGSLKNCVETHKKDALIYRIHGDVFALFVKSDDPNGDIQQEATDIIMAVFEYFKDLEIPVDDIRFDIGINIGCAVTVACSNETNNHALSVLNHAETALIEAKLRKLAFMRYCDLEHIEEQYRENLYWTKKIKNSISGSDPAQIVPYFQPIYNFKTQRIEKFECLARMIENEQPIPPYKFLEPAKNIGLIPGITTRVLERALESFHQTEYEFSINITAQDMSSFLFEKKLMELVGKYNFPTNRIVLEILEDEDMYEYLDIIMGMKKIGFKIAIDDFGSGYSNFNKLQQIQAEYIKIDGSLIKNLDTSESDITLISSLNQYAKSIGARTIAEYVSCETIFGILKEIDIDYAQGFFIGKPLPSVVHKPEF